MREDVRAECIRTIESGVVDESFRFSRRHRWKPLAFDLHGGDAVVVVASRGKRTGGRITAYLFSWREDRWTPTASGGVGSDDRSLPPRPDPGERWFRPWWYGTSVDPETKGPLRSKRVHRLVFQVADGVTHAQWRGHRRSPPDNGFVCVLWRGRSMPTVELFDRCGDRVDEVGSEEIRGPVERLPWWVHVRYLVLYRFHRGGWFHHAPRRR